MFVLKSKVNGDDRYFSGYSVRNNTLTPTWAYMDEAVAVVMYDTLDAAISVKENLDCDSVICRAQCSEIIVD